MLQQSQKSRRRWGCRLLSGRPCSLLQKLFRTRKAHLAALALVGFGVLASILCFFVLRSLETQKVEAQFRRRAQGRLDDLRADLQFASDKVLDLTAFCSTRAPLTHASFHRFAAQVLRDESGIKALEWVPIVRDADRAALEQSARAEGLTGFEIRDRLESGQLVPAGKRSSYAPVLYIHPLAGNELALGYDDLASNGQRREVLERAASSGELRASARLKLVQDDQRVAIILASPVYAYTAAAAQGDSPQLLGFVEGILRIGDVVRRHGEQSGVALSLMDMSASPGERQLYSDPQTAAALQSPFTEYRVVNIGGRLWRVIASPLPGAFQVSNREAYTASGLCLLFTLMVALLITEILGRNDQVEQQVQERSRQLIDALAALEKVHRGLEESESRYRRLVEDSPCGIVVERQGKIVMANRAALEMFGFESEHQPDGHSILEFVTPESTEAATQLHRQLSEREVQIWRREMQVRRIDGSILDAEVAASSFLHDGLHTIQIALLDITQRKHHEATTARLFAAIEQLREGIVITDPQGRIVYVNPAFERISGYARREVIGENPRILNSGKQPASFYAAMWEELKMGEAWSGRFINRAKDGHLFTAETTIAPVVNRSGNLINYVAISRDVTQELELEAQLQQAQKMEAVGRLAGGVSHDFNNMLMVITSYAELALEALDEDHPAREHLAQVKAAANRSFALTRQLLAFSRKQLLSPKVLDCNEMISETSSMVRRLISESIELRCDLAPGLWPVKADPAQFVQVLLNLCLNARDAMSDGGVLTLATRNNIAQDCVEISVTDTGTGIPLELQEKIFEPFFTTKEPGKGTGLGLATVYGILQQSGGQIRVDSAPGHGAAFILALPHCQEEAIASEPPAPSPISDERGIILVVEDEDALRKAVVDQLRARGYRVLDAADGVQALEILAENPQIGILITDLVMPRMGGCELARNAAQKHPGVGIIYISGHADQDLSQCAGFSKQTIFLSKPFDISALLQAIHELHPSPRPERSTSRSNRSSALVN